MSDQLRIALAQCAFSVGDIQANQRKMLETMQHVYQELHADICVFPELALCGYPAEDLLWNPDFKQEIQKALANIQHASVQYPELITLFGFPHYLGEKIFNGMMVLKNGEVLTIVHKQCLPNQGVFNELRYFTPGVDSKILNVKNIKIGLLVCEDIWQKKPLEKLAQKAPELTIIINASPYTIDKHRRRLDLLTSEVEKYNIPLFYLNGVNAQDDLIFDGGSCCVSDHGKHIWQGEFFKENIVVFDVEKKPSHLEIRAVSAQASIPSDEALIYQALVMGLRDYVKKNHLRGTIVGLSGGIDSALTLAIAVDALGADKVMAVSMPSRYTAAVSVEYAETQAKTHGVRFERIDIDPLYNQFMAILAPYFDHLPPDATEENLQSRCRGTLLMALANKYHYIVLNTSNKSECATGYGTLYGDMIGAYAVLKDVLKTWVFRLARYRNSLGEVIPTQVIERAPTAELAPNQTDQDTLPPYPVLDEIITRFVEQQQSVQTIINAGFDATLVRTIINRINKNEYKRRQTPPGPKISTYAFTRERQYPITWGGHTSAD